MTKVIRKKKSSRKARPPISAAEIQRLGFECEHWTEADATIKTRRSLAELFKKHPKLKEAWSRGRFLRNIRELARVGFGVSKAAKLLGLANGQVLQAMIDEDLEVGNLWNKAHLEFHIKVIEVKDKIIYRQNVWCNNVACRYELIVEELIRLCHGQPREKIAEIFEKFVSQIHIKSCKIPNDLNLPATLGRELLEFLQRLKPQDDT